MATWCRFLPQPLATTTSIHDLSGSAARKPRSLSLPSNEDEAAIANQVGAAAVLLPVEKGLWSDPILVAKLKSRDGTGYHQRQGGKSADRHNEHRS